jgi:hypothetical protein
MPCGRPQAAPQPVELLHEDEQHAGRVNHVKYERVVDGLGRLDADSDELSAVRDFSDTLMSGFDGIHADDHHEVVGPVLHVIILQPE